VKSAPLGPSSALHRHDRTGYVLPNFCHESFINDSEENEPAKKTWKPGSLPCFWMTQNVSFQVRSHPRRVRFLQVLSIHCRDRQSL
jgi:hypothetical protein